MIDRLRADNERLVMALDRICGIVLGCQEKNLPSAKIHKIVAAALAKTER